MGIRYGQQATGQGVAQSHLGVQIKKDTIDFWTVKKGIIKNQNQRK